MDLPQTRICVCGFASDNAVVLQTALPTYGKEKRIKKGRVSYSIQSSDYNGSVFARAVV